MVRYTILFCCLAIILASCTKDKIPVIDQPTVPMCDPEINFDNTIQAIVNNSCAIPTCHVAGGNAPGVYTSYQGLLGQLDNGQVEDEVIVQRDMPRAPGVLTEEEFDLFKCWLEAGYPEN